MTKVIGQMAPCPHHTLLPVFEDGAGTVGVPRVQVPVATHRTFPCVALTVVFVATWRREEAVLLKSRPSHISPSHLSEYKRSAKGR